MSHYNSARRRKQRKAIADGHTPRTPFEQLAHLDDVFGSGLGAQRERKRLERRVEAPIASPSGRTQTSRPNAPRHPSKLSPLQTILAVSAILSLGAGR